MRMTANEKMRPNLLGVLGNIIPGKASSSFWYTDTQAGINEYCVALELCTCYGHKVVSSELPCP